MADVDRRVLLDVTDGVALITLHDPKRRNALDLGICDEMAAIFDDIEQREDVGAVVLTGSGSAFCAGADLSHLEKTEREGLLAVYEGFLRVARTPLPTIAAVNGPAVGAGLNLALACDVRVVSPEAAFDTRFIELGIHPGGGHTWMLQRLVSPEVAAAMVVFGEIVKGEQLVERGLAWRCVEADALVDAARQLAARAAAAPRELVTRVKRTMRDTADIVAHDDAVERELVDQVWSIRQPAFQERLAAIKARVAKGSSGG